MKLRNRIFLFIFYLFTSSAMASLFSTEQKNLLEDEKNTIKIYDQTVGSIVHVANIQLARTGWFDPQTSEIPTGSGSGFVWDDKGHIVTNYHVAAGADYFLISFKNDQNQYKAKLVGSAPKKDIAVLKLENFPSGKLIPLAPGDSKELLIGQKALAIGNPFGLDYSLTSGVISALERKIQGVGGVTIHGMIQTDSSINPGNSGGPLLNSRGEMIGMNTIIFSRSGQSAGVGFAVPVNTIKAIVPQLIDHGRVIRPGIGAVLAPDNLRARFGLKKGVILEYVSPKGPAGKAGLEGISQDRYGRWFLGDILLKIDKHEIDSYDDIYHILDKYKVGDSVEITYMRNNSKKTITIKLMKI